jgi:serine/threonine protein kinase
MADETSALETVYFSRHFLRRRPSGRWRKVRCTIVSAGRQSRVEISGPTKAPRDVTEISPALHADVSNEVLTIRHGSSVLFTFKWGHLHRMKECAMYIRNLSARCEYTMQDFDIMSVLGKGSDGKVMLCRWKGTNEFYAIKSIRKSRLIKARTVHTIFRERTVLVKARHPFIVDLLFAFQTDKKCYLGMELVAGGELYRRLRDAGQLSIDETRLYVAEIGMALDHLHNQNVIYRDLKPENVMIGADGHIKLTDFGLAKLSEERGKMTSTFCGTPEYLAPEILTKRPYNEAVDWWALGVIMYEMLFGKTPFFNRVRNKMFQSIADATFEFPEGADPRAADLISKLIVKKPEERITFKAFKQHPFFEGMSFRAVFKKRIKPPYLLDIPDKLCCVQYFEKEFTKLQAEDSDADPVEEAFEGFSFMAPDSDAPGRE